MDLVKQVDLRIRADEKRQRFLRQEEGRVEKKAGCKMMPNFSWHAQVGY